MMTFLKILHKNFVIVLRRFWTWIICDPWEEVVLLFLILFASADGRQSTRL